MCVVKTAAFEKYTVVTKQAVSDTVGDKSNLIDGKKYGDMVKSEHTLNRMTLVTSVSNTFVCRLYPRKPLESDEVVHIWYHAETD